MNKICINISAICTALVVTVMSLIIASSVAALPVNLYVGGGISDPTADLATGANVGYYGSTRVGIPLGPNAEILGGVDYHSFNLDEIQLAGVSGRFWTFMIAGDLKMDLGLPAMPINPFLLAGGGIAKIDLSGSITQFTGVGTFSADSDSKPFVEFGGGFELNQLYAQLKLVNIFNDDSDARFVSLGLGVKLYLI